MWLSSDGYSLRLSSPDPDLPGPRDGVHADEETGAQTAHPARLDGPESRRIARRTKSKSETGKPEVLIERDKCRESDSRECLHCSLVLQAFQR